jgi:uncharacterized protein (DUF2336 family)
MATTASAALFVELEAAVSGGSSERRVSILRQVTDLFLSDADRLNATQVAVFDDVLMQLVERVETRALAQLSKTLSVAAIGPNRSIHHLAFHQDASVAAPVLTQSSVLTDADLIKVANSRGQQHLLAISARKTLNEAVTDVLIERGDNTVVQSLTQNSGARFSTSGYSSLVDKAADNEGLTEALGLRLDIPINFLRDLLAKASEAVKARLLKAAPAELLEKIRTAIDSVIEEIGGKPAKPIDYTAAEAAVLALNRAGNLSDSAVNRFAIEQNYKNVTAALALLGSISIDSIEPLLKNGRIDGLIVACKASRLSWSTTNMIIRNRPQCTVPTRLELEQGKEVFDALSLSAAQRTMRFWSARESGRKSDGSKAPAAPALRARP